MTDPREFSCMDDAPENNGWGWYRWPEPRDDRDEFDEELENSYDEPEKED